MNRSESTQNGGEDEAATETKSNFGVVMTGVAFGVVMGVALAAAAAIGIAGAVFVFGSSSSSSSSESGRTMIAPGTNGETMFRDDFEEDPKTYFRDLRKK
ncbi:hypothetical protein K1719_022825 [Acacia pycnantha]|nr:hypothetical protein K1719_022825 [Acacia pycnantha]